MKRYKTRLTLFTCIFSLISGLNIAGTLASVDVAPSKSATADFRFSAPSQILPGNLVLSQTSSSSGTETPAPATEFPDYACACGCGVFEVATASMLPRGQGGMVWEEWDFQDQYRNHSGSGPAPADQNDDKGIRTNFFTTGLQYFFDRKWGIQAEVPIDNRRFVNDQEGTTNWTTLGDIRIKGLYTGFSEDQSIGIDFGVKLATGSFTEPNVDRDTQIGTGSTDLLLGGFYRTALTQDSKWTAFAQVEADLPVVIQDEYRPGFETDFSAGVYYSGFAFRHVTISPLAQIIYSYRTSDGGDNSAQPVASGYNRVLLSPGLEIDLHPFTIYGDLEFPVYQYLNGNQLAAPFAAKVILSFHF